MTNVHGRHLRPCQTGLRFSMKARTPFLRVLRLQRLDQRRQALARASAAARCAVRRTTCLIARTESGAQASTSSTQRADRGVELGARHNLVHQPDAEGLRCLDPLAGEQQSHGRR